MKPDATQKTLNSYVIAAISLFIGIFLGIVFRGLFLPQSAGAMIETREAGYEFIKPLLECDQESKTTDNVRLKPFRKTVDAIIKKDFDRKWADEVSVYFRELDNGMTFSLGETGKFFPASLLKVPIMMSILKEAETDPNILRHKISFSDPNVKRFQNDDAAKKLEFGKAYAIDELIARMVIYSDNISTNLLENYANADVLERTYDALGIKDPYRGVDQTKMVASSTKYMVSAETYGLFFRILYNASYLSKSFSEKALNLLAQSDFKEGLVAGVPVGIKVAHKFGWRVTGLNGEIKQLHDCGIVYYPDEPYLLCVMTSGSNYKYLDDAIREISRQVYEEVDKQHHPPS